MNDSESLDKQLFSATVAKKGKRGRPAKYASPEQAAFLESFNGSRKPSRRSNQNHINMARAHGIVSSTGKNQDNQMVLEYFSKRQTLFSEIGRIKDMQILANVAYTIAQKKLRGSTARALINANRGIQPEPESPFLMMAEAVCEYVRQNPTKTKSEASATLKKYMFEICDSPLLNPLP